MHQESKEINDDAWDCTLIKNMKEHNDVVVTPIYYWSDADIWEYIKTNNMAVNPLYKKGYNRVGCIGCPLATYKHVIKEFSDYPKYREAYIKAFDRMLVERKKAGMDGSLCDDFHKWENGEDVFEWWIETYKRQVKGQMDLFSEEK